MNFQIYRIFQGLLKIQDNKGKFLNWTTQYGKRKIISVEIENQDQLAKENDIEKQSLNKLQIIQNKFLRLIGNYSRFPPIDQLHDELMIESVNNYLYIVVKNYFSRIETHKNILVRNILYDKNISYKHKRIMKFL